MELILASNSPRRKDILNEQGFEFSIKVSDYRENEGIKEPIKMTTDNALGKAKAVFNTLENKTEKVVLGADTVVYFKGKILGKPKNEQQAYEMLKSLSGNVHTVITGYALIKQGKELSDYDKTEVLFNELSDEFIWEYIKTGSPMDKAGAYGIQDEFKLVKNISGSLNNVIGLPIEKIKEQLKGF